MRDLRDYRGFARAVATALGAALETPRGRGAPRALAEPGSLVLCPWPVAAGWFDRGTARGGARRCVVLDGDEEWLVERGAPWRLAAGVSSGALSWWLRPVPFAYPMVVGRVAVAERIGADLLTAERWADGYTSFTHRDAADLVDLLCRYLLADLPAAGD